MRDHVKENAIALACGLAGILLVACVTALAQQPKPDPRDLALARCRAELTIVQVDVAEGKLLPLADIKRRFEAANPSFELDPTTFVLTPKPK